MTDQHYITAPQPEIYWRYEVPQNTDAKVFLLTRGFVAVVGNWRGAYGEQFIAWAPMLKRNKDTERRLGLLPAKPQEQ